MMHSATRLIALAAVFFSFSSFATTYSGKDIVSGKRVSFPSASAKATVVMFLSAKCPCSASHEEPLKELAQKYSKEGFEFVAVHSNQNEAADVSKKHFKEVGLGFPVIEDHGAGIADGMKALKTPHVFVFQKDQIVYQGGVDDSADAAEAKTPYLANALKELKEGKPVTVAKARALGCQIKRE